ncbi:S9 family peptidase [Streptomyces sp. NPDC004609]|uniref:S9 family peptidase n=1 Tax=Streptomyces sp. NPDC004609 TaxID=3364704 RepID=UPI0036B7EAC3
MAMATTPRGPFAPERLHTQVAIGQLDVHSAAEGGLIVFTRRTVVGGRDRIGLWAQPYAGGPARPLTDGPWCDTRPRFSPDGRSLAFLRDAQLYVLELPDSGPRRVAKFPRGVQDFDWGPDGGWLAVLAEDGEAPEERYEEPPYAIGGGGPRGGGTASGGAAGADATAEAEGSEAAGAETAGSETAGAQHPPAGDRGPTCRVLERAGWRLDGEGLLLHPRQVHRVSLDGPVRRLTDGPRSLARPRVGPDGTVYVLADPGPDADLAPCPQVHAISAQGLRPVTAMAGGVVRHHVRADGTLTVVGRAGKDPRDQDPPQAFRIDPAAGRVEPLLTECADRWVGALGGESDLHDWWTEPEDCAEVTAVAHADGVRPYDLVTGRPLAEPGTVAASLARHGALTAAVLVPPGTIAAPEVYALDPGAPPRRLTTGGSAWLDDRELPTVERIEAPGPAGPVTVHLVHPPGADPAAALPTVVSLHGGPTGQWGPLPNLEALLLASAGYRVALPNPRGSTDRGSAWVGGLYGAWGRADAEDVHAVVDHLLATGRSVPGRLGVCGLSYGGFLTHWLIATGDRFAAAVAENGVSNQVSAWANCDIGPAYGDACGMGDPLDEEGAARLWEASPLRLVSRIRTPLLMLQAEDDLRCPPADNEQLFLALRRLRRTVRYVLYPESSHLYQGTGRFDRRVDRHRRLLDWFRTHLPLDSQ